MKFDAYSLKARLAPTFLVLLPICLSLAAWLPSEFFASWRVAVGFLTYCGVICLLAELGRDLGKKKEPNLFKLWGGKPTTRMLRHRHSSLDKVTLARYHAKLSDLINQPFPNRESEKDDPKAADALYESGIKVLLERTRDSEKYSLLLKENTSYGFRRNLWGMRPAAILICIVCLLITVGRMWVVVTSNNEVPITTFLIPLGIIFILALWVCRITPAWVRISSDAYAIRLLAACETL